MPIEEQNIRKHDSLLAREAELFGSLQDNLWAGTSTYFQRNKGKISLEAVGSVFAGAGLVALTKRPALFGESLAPFLRQGVSILGEVGAGIAVCDWGMKVVVPAYDVWKNPNNLEANKRELAKNIATGLVDYSAMGLGGLAGGSLLNRLSLKPSLKSSLDLAKASTGATPLPTGGPGRLASSEIGTQATYKSPIADLSDRKYASGKSSENAIGQGAGGLKPGVVGPKSGDGKSINMGEKAAALSYREYSDFHLLTPLEMEILPLSRLENIKQANHMNLLSRVKHVEKMNLGFHGAPEYRAKGIDAYLAGESPSHHLYFATREKLANTPPEILADLITSLRLADSYAVGPNKRLFVYDLSEKMQSSGIVRFHQKQSPPVRNFEPVADSYNAGETTVDLNSNITHLGSLSDEVLAHYQPAIPLKIPASANIRNEVRNKQIGLFGHEIQPRSLDDYFALCHHLSDIRLQSMLNEVLKIVEISKIK